jgi:transposase InsO family protein
MKDGRMKRKRFTEEQIIAVLREHEAGAKAGDLAREHGISEATLYNWKAKYGGMDVSDAERLKALEDENGKLKKLLADQMLEEARSCRASTGRHGPVGTAGLMHRRRGPEDGALPLMSSAETELRGRLRDLARERRRFSYRRLFILLRREGEPSGINRIYRLFREEGLTVRKRRARRRAVSTRAPILVEARRMRAGRSTSCMTSLPAGGASAC